MTLLYWLHSLNHCSQKPITTSIKLFFTFHKIISSNKYRFISRNTLKWFISLVGHFLAVILINMLSGFFKTIEWGRFPGNRFFFFFFFKFTVAKHLFRVLSSLSSFSPWKPQVCRRRPACLILAHWPFSVEGFCCDGECVAGSLQELQLLSTVKNYSKMMHARLTGWSKLSENVSLCWLRVCRMDGWMMDG